MEPAHSFANDRSGALILGAAVVAKQIETQLATHGMDTIVLESDRPLPSPADPNSADELKEIFVQTIRESRKDIRWIHPGVSYWGQKPDLLRIAGEIGLEVLAPPQKAISFFSNKLSFLEEANKLGIPTGALSFEPIHSAREVKETLKRHALPIVLKAVGAGAGGASEKIIRSDTGSDELRVWQDQLKRNTGESFFFAEKYVEDARQVTLPFARSQSGEYLFLPTIDSSLKYRNRKIVEMTAELSSNLTDRLRDFATRIADKCLFVGFGAFEFLVDGDRITLIEGLPRLNTGFRLWEKVSGLKAVDVQLAAHFGNSFPKPLPSKANQNGLSVRLYAEDSFLQIPQPGVLHEFSGLDSGDDVEVHCGVSVGAEVNTESSGLVATMISIGKDLEENRSRLISQLESLWVSGSLQTNQTLVEEILRHPRVRERMFHTYFLDEEFVPVVRPPNALARMLVDVCSWIEHQVRPNPPKGLWQIMDGFLHSHPDRVRWLGEPDLFEVNGLKGVQGVVQSAGPSGLRICAYPTGRSRWQMRAGKWTAVIQKIEIGTGNTQGRVLSQVNGRVHAILFQRGDEIPKHEPIVFIESLQTLVSHSLPLGARITSWKVRAEDHVKAGQVLATYERIQE